MTKSRTALPTLLAAVAAAWPGTALAQLPPATAEATIAAYDIWFETVTDGAGQRGVRRCRRGAGEDEIVVCANPDDSAMRIPYEPTPGAPIRLIAGEPPSGLAALNVGDACCGGGGGINVIALFNALDRGLDRILHPD